MNPEPAMTDFLAHPASKDFDDTPHNREQILKICRNSGDVTPQRLYNAFQWCLNHYGMESKSQRQGREQRRRDALAAQAAEAARPVAPVKTADDLEIEEAEREAKHWAERSVPIGNESAAAVHVRVNQEKFLFYRNKKALEQAQSRPRAWSETSLQRIARNQQAFANAERARIRQRAYEIKNS
jgi:hypothetical protein